MAKEHKKMVSWIDYENDPNRIPKPNTTVLMVVNYEVCIGYYDVKLGSAISNCDRPLHTCIQSPQAQVIRKGIQKN